MNLLNKLVSLVPALRSTRVLDDRKMGRVAREEAVVHALLRNREAAPLEAAPEGLRRAIAMRIENTRQVPARRTWAVSPRVLASAVPVLALTIGGAMLLQTRSQSTPTTLEPVVQRPFTPIVAVRADESGVAGFPAGTVDEGLLTAGPLVTPRRTMWNQHVPAQTQWASDKAKVDPLLLEARQFEFQSRTAAQVLIANQLQNQQNRKRAE